MTTIPTQSYDINKGSADNVNQKRISTLIFESLGLGRSIPSPQHKQILLTPETAKHSTTQQYNIHSIARRGALFDCYSADTNKKNCEGNREPNTRNKWTRAHDRYQRHRVLSNREKIHVSVCISIFCLFISFHNVVKDYYYLFYTFRNRLRCKNLHKPKFLINDLHVYDISIINLTHTSKILQFTGNNLMFVMRSCFYSRKIFKILKY